MRLLFRSDPGASPAEAAVARAPGRGIGRVCCPPAAVAGSVPGWGAPDRSPHSARGQKGGAAEGSKPDRERQVCRVTHVKS